MSSTASSTPDAVTVQMQVLRALQQLRFLELGGHILFPV